VFRTPDATRWIFIAYLALLLWVPVPFGSNRPWSWAVLEIWVFLLAIVWLVGCLRGRVSSPAIIRDAWPALACALLWLTYVWFQLVPLPMEILARLSPQAARWHTAAALPDARAFAPITLDRFATLEGACRSTAYVAFFVLTLALLDTSARIRATAYTLIVSGVLQAWYGALVALRSASAVASGTFVNRNHYAAYLVLCLSIGIGVLIASLSGSRSPSWGHFFRNFIQWIITPKMALRLGLLVMVIALVLTRSRMGNSSFFISLLVTGGVGLLLSKRATRSMVILIATLVIVDVAVVGTYFGVERVVERIEQTQPGNERREAVRALDVWPDFPVFGSGLGSFHVVFPRYSGPDAGEIATHAHNDYIQFAIETGAIGVILLGLLALTSLAAALRAQYLRQEPLMRGLSFGAIMAIIALGIHCAVDFNLQIPAIAMTFMLVLALAWISLYHRSVES